MVKERLYNKYRPQKANDMLGQDKIVQFVNSYIENKHYKNVRELLLYSNIGGVGKTTTALLIAEAINPDQKDTNLIVHLEGSKIQGIDTIRELREQVEVIPPNGGYRVVIIDELHMLSHPAQNELLALLEFSKIRTIFIFTTTKLSSVEQPLVSRCLQLPFHRIPPETIESYLIEICEKENFPFVPQAINRIATNAEGSMRVAIRELEKAHIDGDLLNPNGENDHPFYTAINEISYGNIASARVMLYQLESPDFRRQVAFRLVQLTQDTALRNKYSFRDSITSLIENFLKYKPQNSEEFILWVKNSMPKVSSTTETTRKRRRTISSERIRQQLKMIGYTIHKETTENRK